MARYRKAPRACLTELASSSAQDHEPFWTFLLRGRGRGHLWSFTCGLPTVRVCCELGTVHPPKAWKDPETAAGSHCEGGFPQI